MRQLELRNRWWLVAASFCAMYIGAGTMLYVLAVFLQPVTQDLGISRKTFSTGILVASIAMALACPPLGLALDRWGQRKVLLPLIAASALAAAALSSLTASVPHILGLFALWGVLAAGVSPVPFARALSERFHSKRGLALGIAICGAGFGTVSVPPIMAALIQSQGWRNGFLIYGAAIAVLALIPVALVMRGEEMRDATQRPEGRSDLEGLSLSQALKTRRFWILLAASLLGIIAINGCVSHMTALLIDRGLPIAKATVALSLVGVGAIVGRLMCGWMLDRIQSSRVAILFYAFPALGVTLLASGGAVPTPFIAALLLGLGVGGEVDMLAYFTGRYFGMRAFGRIYGLLFALFSVGGGMGPFLSGVAYEIYKSYSQVFVVYQIALLAAAALVWCLGAYRYAAGGPHEQAAAKGSEATAAAPA